MIRNYSRPTPGLHLFTPPANACYKAIHKLKCPQGSEGDIYYSLMCQPEIRPISQDQLVAEVKGIYAGLVMVEKKCIEVDNAQPDTNPDNQPQFQATALHRTHLHEHHDFFLTSQHPSPSVSLRRLAAEYAMPARMWRHGIHSFHELLLDRQRHYPPLGSEVLDPDGCLEASARPYIFATRL